MKLLSETWELRSALGIGDASRRGRGGGCFMDVLVAYWMDGLIELMVMSLWLYQRWKITLSERPFHVVGSHSVCLCWQS